MKETICGADLRRMIISAAAGIEINKQALNELNVFPVPDGDTGTNMSMTSGSAAADLRKAEDPALDKAAKIAASAMLRGARGNSGVILSLLFRGISKGLKGHEVCDGVLWAEALQQGVDAAYKAVMKPLEMPRKSRDRMTPELPLAPLSMADAAILAALSRAGSSALRRSAAAEPLVMDILVPVSPSGTGKTFSSLSACL